MRDINGATDMAIVAVTVDLVNDPPVANDDTATSEEDTACAIPVLAHDTVVEDVTPGVPCATNGANGIATVNDDGTITYTPAASFSGTDQFTYTAVDTDGATDTVTVSVTVSPISAGKACAVLVGTQPSEAFTYDGGCLYRELRYDDFDRDETTSDTLTFGYQGETMVLNEVEDCLIPRSRSRQTASATRTRCSKLTATPPSSCHATRTVLWPTASCSSTA